MPQQGVEIAVACVVFGFSGMGLRQALAFPGRSSAMPVAVLGFAMILCCAWIGQSAISWYRERRRVSIDPTELRRLCVLIVFSAIYVACITLVGFFTATFLFTPLTAFCLGFRRWLSTALATLVFIVVLYAVFGLLLKTPLPPEILGRLIGQTA